MKQIAYEKFNQWLVPCFRSNYAPFKFDSIKEELVDYAISIIKSNKVADRNEIHAHIKKIIGKIKSDFLLGPSHYDYLEYSFCKLYNRLLKEIIKEQERQTELEGCIA
jgi:hypothetical protein